jgi:mannosyltransferase OCH1-like enzyme
MGGWDYRLWIDEDRRQLMEETFPEFASRFRKIKQGIVRADIARYAFLYRDGGVYLDTDYKILRPLGEFVSTACLLPIEVGQLGDSDLKLGNAVLASSKNHPFWRDLITDIFHINDCGFDGCNPVLATGPLALTRFWLQNASRYPDIVTPAQSVFYPELAWSNFSYRRSHNTHGVHLCWGSWRGKKGIQLVRNVIRRKVTCLAN